jgi:hypothetical protein
MKVMNCITQRRISFPLYQVDSFSTPVCNDETPKPANVSRMINRDIEGDTQWNQFSEEFSGIHQDF